MANPFFICYCIIKFDDWLRRQALKLPKITKLPAYLRRLRADVSTIQNALVEVQRHQHKAEETLETVQHTQSQLAQRLTEIDHVLNIIKRNKTTQSPAEVAGKTRFADDHTFDTFYIELENNFRGTEAEIKTKQRPYLKLFEGGAIDYKKFPVIDLGAGRGEFLELLEEQKIRCIGADLNESMVKSMKDKGFEAVKADVVDYLAAAKSNSLGAITGFHLAEHIPFEQLLLLIAEAYRSLAKGGFLLLETPNPENVTVGAFTFHYDPSHLKPIPPAILDFMAKFKGFRKTEILRRQPELTDKQIQAATSDKQIQDVLKRLYGPRDYALLAYK